MASSSICVIIIQGAVFVKSQIGGAPEDPELAKNELKFKFIYIQSNRSVTSGVEHKYKNP
jgi:hypothetical protein